MSLRELQGNVLREFGVEEGLFVAALSYWPPSSLELATGIKTPPRSSTDNDFVERVEEVINCGSAFRQEEVLGGSNVGEDAVDERDVRPRGYDKEFWSPLLKDDFWGNVNSRYSSKNLAKMVTSTAMAFHLGDYRDLLSKVKSQKSECGVYLTKIASAHWSRANFLGDRYNIMTSNIAEQLNHALVEGRTSPIMELVIFIQRMMTRWFSARRRKAENHRGIVSVEVDKVMTNNMATMKGSKVNSFTEWSCEIIGKYVWECIMRLWLVTTTRHPHGGRHMLE
ncbi:unnamed protein product [Brassica oleracea var. botrytis]